MSGRHNPNIGIISSGNSFAEKIFFGSYCWRRYRIGIEPFACSAYPKNERVLYGVVLGDNLSLSFWLFYPHWPSYSPPGKPRDFFRRFPALAAGFGRLADRRGVSVWLWFTRGVRRATWLPPTWDVTLTNGDEATQPNLISPICERTRLSDWMVQ